MTGVIEGGAAFADGRLTVGDKVCVSGYVILWLLVWAIASKCYIFFVINIGLNIFVASFSRITT